MFSPANDMELHSTLVFSIFSFKLGIIYENLFMIFTPFLPIDVFTPLYCNLQRVERSGCAKKLNFNKPLSAADPKAGKGSSLLLDR